MQVHDQRSRSHCAAPRMHVHGALATYTRPRHAKNARVRASRTHTKAQIVGTEDIESGIDPHSSHFESLEMAGRSWSTALVARIVGFFVGMLASFY